MDDRLARLERQVQTLVVQVAACERRLLALERGAEVSDGSIGVRAADAGSTAGGGAWTGQLPVILALIGRTLVILAGAFAVRALTDAGTLAVGPGLLLGAAFGSVWIILADRAGMRGRPLQATCHGAAFLLILLPLLYEAVTRFQLLGVPGAAVALTGVAGLALAVAARCRLLGLAWLTTAGALAVTAALMLVTAEIAPFACVLVLLGVATLWLGYVLDWTLLRWPAALAADLSILILTGRAVTAGVADSPGMALAVQIVLVAAYLGSCAARTLYLGREVVPFEVAQSALAFVIGVGGMAYVAQAAGVGTAGVGVATLGLAAGCYGAAIVFLRSRQGRERNFSFYTSAGLALLLAGFAFTCAPLVLAVIYAGVGVAIAAAGRGHVTFRVHAAVCLAAAAAVSGLFVHVLYGFGIPIRMPAPLSPAVTVVLLACLGSLCIMGNGTDVSLSILGRLPRLAVLLLSVGGLLGVADVALVRWLRAGDVAASAGLVAMVRTAVLVLAVLALASSGRRLIEGAWLVYPLLIVTGLKFALEDLPAGRPGTLVLSFAFYGVGLIAGPWLSRRLRPNPQVIAPDPTAP